MYSNKSNDIQLTKIVSPSLNDVEYAKGLDGVFDNIDNNFNILANRDFVKGENGDSINTRIVYFFENGELNEYGKKLKQCIEDSSTVEERKSLYDKYNNEISLWDAFNDDPGHLFMSFGVNKDVINSVEKPLNSFYYVFLDGRYTTSKLQNIDVNLYSDIKDLSCVVMYDSTVNDGNGGFKIISNIFPTMYFEPSIGLCWKINGAKTGLSIQGVPGKPGLNSPIIIVKCKDLISKDGGIFRGKVDQLFDSYKGFIDVPKNYKTLLNTTCLIFSNNNSNIYFGTLNEQGDKLYCYCSQNTPINNAIRSSDIISALKNISTKTSNTISPSLKGLFVPVSNEKNNSQSVHLLTSLASSDTIDKNNSNKNDLILSPIKDIDSFNTDDSNSSIDKYLYLRINKNSELFNNESTNADIIDTLNSKSGIQRYDYILKYKFVDKIVNLKIQYNDRETINSNFDVLQNDGTGSRYFTKSGVNIEGVQLSLDDNKVVYNSIKDKKISNSHIDSIPEEFMKKFDDKSGIYRWELCDIKHTWDPNSMLKNEYDSKYYYSDYDNINNGDDLKNLFSVIFTPSLCPNDDTNFMWFNSICIDDSLENGINSRITIPGWNYELYPNTLEFVKFITVNKDKDYYVNTDNTFNINYDVNITGEESSLNRNLFVSGNISSKNLYTSNKIMINDGKYEFGLSYNKENIPVITYKKFDSDIKEIQIEQIFNLIKDVELIKEKISLIESEKSEEEN